MKLAFCIFKYFPYGGVARDLAGIAEECIRRGHSVRAYAIRWEGDPPGGVEKIDVPARGMTNPARYRRFARWVGEHLQRSPVDLVVGFNKMPGLDVYLAGDSCYEEKARHQRGWHYRLLPRYRHFSGFERAVFDGDRPVKVLTVAAAQQPTFKRYYGTPDERFFPLPPGVEPSAGEREGLAPRKKEPGGGPSGEDGDAPGWLRREFDLPETGHVLLFVGSGFATKGLDRAIRALSDLRRNGADAVLLVVGDDNSRSFERLASRLGVGGSLRFAGGRGDVPRILKGADALVLPAYNEAAGVVILEALAAGLPVLCTDVCGFAPYVAEADAGIVSSLPFDQDRFNREVREVLTSPRRAAWRENGRRLAASGSLGGRAEVACDLIERFVRGDIQPTVAICVHRVVERDGLSRDVLALKDACREKGWQVRVYTMSWQVPEASANGADVVVVPVASMADHKRVERFERWVQGALRRSPVHCVVGFNKMPGLDLCLAAEPCALREADRLRTRLYRGTPRFRQLACSEEAVFAGGTTVVARNASWAADHREHYDVEPEVLPPLEVVRPSPGDRSTHARADVRRGWGADDDACVLLSVGTAGLERVLMTVAALPDDRRQCLQLIALDAPAGARAMAAGLGLTDRIRFASTDAGDCYLGADLLVHPPYRDLAGHAVLDALVAGLPVVTVADVGHSEHVSRAGAGTVVDAPFEALAFKRALADALDTKRREVWRENALRYVARTRFDGAARVVELIGEHVKRRGRALSA